MAPRSISADTWRRPPVLGRREGTGIVNDIEDNKFRYHDDLTFKDSILLFKEKYEKKFHKMMKKKLGLITDEADDVILIQELLDTMEKNNLDYTCLRLLLVLFYLHSQYQSR